MMDQTSPARIQLFDAYDPPQVAQRVREVGVAKATAPIQTPFALALLGGAFISMGAAFYTVTITGAGSGALPLGLACAAGIALVYWFVYLRHETNTAADSEVHTQDAA